MLMCAECHIGFIDKGIRKFFGFLYSFLGRTCFILLYVAGWRREALLGGGGGLASHMIMRRCRIHCAHSAASINFAMDSWVGYIVGIATLVNALFNFYVIKFHPGFKAAGMSAQSDPYSTYTGGDDVRARLAPP